MTVYNKVGWKDHIVNPITNEVIQEGTPLNQDNLNHMDDEIERLGQQMEKKADKESPQFTGTPTINGNEIATVNNIPAGLSLGETSSTAYRGDRGKVAYDHSQSAHAPSTAQKNSDITKAEIEAKLIGEISTHYHASDSTKAPTMHAVADGTYGLGTYSAYGHVKTYQGLDFTGADAFALHANQGKVLNDKIVSFTNNFTFNRLPTRQLLASGNITVTNGTKLVLVTTFNIVEPIDIIYVGACQWGYSGGSIGGFYSFVFPFDIARCPYCTSGFGSNTHRIDSTIGINLINDCGFKRVGNTIQVYMSPYVEEPGSRTHPYKVEIYY